MQESIQHMEQWLWSNPKTREPINIPFTSLQLKEYLSLNIHCQNVQIDDKLTNPSLVGNRSFAFMPPNRPKTSSIRHCSKQKDIRFKSKINPNIKASHLGNIYQLNLFCFSLMSKSVRYYMLTSYLQFRSTIVCQNHTCSSNKLLLYAKHHTSSSGKRCASTRTI